MSRQRFTTSKRGPLVKATEAIRNGKERRLKNQLTREETNQKVRLLYVEAARCNGVGLPLYTLISGARGLLRPPTEKKWKFPVNKNLEKIRVDWRETDVLMVRA